MIFSVDTVYTLCGHCGKKWSTNKIDIFLRCAPWPVTVIQFHCCGPEEPLDANINLSFQPPTLPHHQEMFLFFFFVVFSKFFVQYYYQRALYRVLTRPLSMHNFPRLGM